MFSRDHTKCCVSERSVRLKKTLWFCISQSKFHLSFPRPNLKPLHKATNKREGTEINLILNMSCSPKWQEAIFEAKGNEQ